LLWAGAVGAWPTQGIPLEHVAPPAQNGSMGLGADGLGGAFATWPERDSTGAYAFRLHRLDANGAPPAGWSSAGMRVLAPVGMPSPALVPDGAGGTYIVWAEFDSLAYVGHVDAAGSLVAGWPARGLPISSVKGFFYLLATDDGAGGVMLVWSRVSATASAELYSQRFLPGGTRAPGFTAGGLALTSSASGPGRVDPRLLRDADRGYWVSFQNVGSPSTYSVLHLDSSGLLTGGQPVNGHSLSVPASEVGSSAPYVPVALALDGGGGVFAFTLGNNGNVRAFHVLSSVSEDPIWPSGGVVLAGSAGWPSIHFGYNEQNWPVASGDLAGSAWVSWVDNSDFLLHGTRVRIDGTIAPGWSPRPIAGVFRVTLLADPDGVYACSLAPTDCPHFDCYGPLTVSRWSTGGSVAEGWPGWDYTSPSNPVPGIVFGHGGPNNLDDMVSDGAGGVVVGWIEYPNYFVRHFTSIGALAGVPAAPLGAIAIRARFDPSDGVRVSFSTGSFRVASIDLFDVTGRRLASASVAAGAGEITLPGTRALSGGVYFARLSSGGHAAVARLVAFR
jgi:hypothetical protein